MTTEIFDSLINDRLELCKQTLCSKAEEYATEDRLHNFKVAGAVQGITPRQALLGMMAKHTVSVYDMATGDYPLEMWDEKIGDSINYLLLLHALVRDEIDYDEKD